ncbi:MAG: DNA repair protein RecN [Candidatus Omnitrophica bacterium]|nr:DNA repair protein RecN [Candidatus Omnitrophota bacterium]
MLVQLHIQNFALMDNLAIEFDPSLNVLTGETGAGKSILLDAIRFVLGERMDALKAGVSAKAFSVEAVFDPGKKIRKLDLLSTYFENDEEVLILRRETSLEGRSRAWANGRMVNISALKELGAFLIDIHGQYDHQLLLDQSQHLDLLDRFVGADDIGQKYEALFAEYSALLKHREELASLEAGREREIDILKFQIDEITQAKLKNDDEVAELEKERVRFANAEKLYESVSALTALLDEDDDSVTTLLGKARPRFNELLKFDDSMADLKKEFETVETSLAEIARSLQHYRDSLTFEPDRLRQIEARLDAIYLLKKKYGGSVEKILEFYAEARKKYDSIVNAEVYGRETEQKISRLLPKISALADELSEKRKKAAQSLKKTIERELKDLGIDHARFECQFDAIDFSPAGRDRVEFMISPNLGQPILPLRKIISAGEVSRVMLAMKKALAKVDPVETLIFDEIDANIGGRMGTVTGEKLKEIAGERQVLLITHLPQIASFADRHFKVTKVARQGKTSTEYQVIAGEARVKELAQMMSGKSESDISRKHAEEMLAQAENLV